jgi:hypothetical protein
VYPHHQRPRPPPKVVTVVTAVMTMNRRGSLKGVRHSAVESRERAMGREHSERKADKARRRSRLVWPLGDRKRYMLQLQRLAYHAHRIIVQPVQAGLLA